jgi:hypothetical protein
VIDGDGKTDLAVWQPRDGRGRLVERRVRRR